MNLQCYNNCNQPRNKSTIMTAIMKSISSLMSNFKTVKRVSFSKDVKYHDGDSDMTLCYERAIFAVIEENITNLDKFFVYVFSDEQIGRLWINSNKNTIRFLEAIDRMLSNLTIDVQRLILRIEYEETKRISEMTETEEVESFIESSLSVSLSTSVATPRPKTVQYKAVPICLTGGGSGKKATIQHVQALRYVMRLLRECHEKIQKKIADIS